MTTHAARRPPRRDVSNFGLETREAGRVGVVALVDTDLTTSAAIQRAADLARSVGGRLALVGNAALDHRAWEGLPRARRRFAHAVADLELDVAIETNVRVGAAISVAIAAGLECRPALVVMSPDAGGCGHAAAAIANALEIPVFVARTPRAAGPIVAATNMTHLRYPVLAAGAGLARVLAKPVTFVHNTSPSSGSARYDLAEGALAVTHARLRALAGQADAKASALVTRTESVVDTILDLARRQQADVVSIGSRRRSWFERFRNNVAVEIVDRCACSVLVVPVERSC
jgi:nucleotide-binding universal stress UspA family protein